MPFNLTKNCHSYVVGVRLGFLLYERTSYTSWRGVHALAVLSVFLATWGSLRTLLPVALPRLPQSRGRSRPQCPLPGPLLSSSESIILASVTGSLFEPIGFTAFLSSGLPVTPPFTSQWGWGRVYLKVPYKG